MQYFQALPGILQIFSENIFKNEYQRFLLSTLNFSSIFTLFFDTHKNLFIKISLNP